MEFHPYAGEISDRLRPVRVRFGLPLIFVLLTVCALVIAPIASCQRRHYQSKLALEEIRAFCMAKGGSYGRRLVNGEVEIDLAGASLTTAEASRLHSLIDRIVPEYIDYNGMVILDLSNTQIESGVLGLMHPRICELNLSGTPTNDDQLTKIVKQTPNLNYLNLNDTQVSDKCIKSLLDLPLYGVSVRRTQVSLEGRRRLEKRSVLVR